VALVLLPVPWKKPLVILGAAFGLAVSLLVVVAGCRPELVLNQVWKDRTEAPSETAEDVAKMLDNEKIAEELLERHRPGEIVGSESYSLVHQFAFLTKGKLPTRLANIGGGHHGLASLYWHKPEDLAGKDALFMTEKEHLDGKIHALFESCEEEAPIAVERDGFTVRTLRLFRCRGLLEPVPVWTRLSYSDFEKVRVE
jgi:hypothetical protein